MDEPDLENLLVDPGSDLYLDFGSDAQSCGRGDLEISERGMSLISRWVFEIGTRMEVACVQKHPLLGAQRVNLEAIVVRCEELARAHCPAKTFQTTLIFLELPEDFKPVLRNFSAQLGG